MHSHEDGEAKTNWNVHHIADSVLCNEDPSGKKDNTWLDVSTDVYRGRTFMRHDWKGDIGGKLVALHFAGNDFKGRKGKVKGALPGYFDEVFRSKLSDVKKEAREVVFVMWGDWDFWKHGFWGEINSTESGSRFDAMAASVCQAASNMGIRVIWLRSADLRHMELTSDRWHFRSSAREHLQIILQAIFPDVPLPTASPTGCMASLLESCVDPLDIWRNGDIVEVPTAVAGYTIPKIRHVTGPCWKTELGQGLVDFIRELHERSAPHGWICRYWSHAAMDAEMQRCPYVHLREAYFSIDPQYYVARSDLFRPYLLHEYGGLWLDLRGCPSVDMEMIGLEQIFRKCQGAPPPIILERCGGLHKQKFRGAYGQISNGWMASASKLAIWQRVIDNVVRMVADYHKRASWTAEGQLVDNTLLYFTVPVSMTGREGVLCQGPLGATPVIHEYLIERGAVDQCMPECVRDVFSFNRLTPKNSAWCNMQGRVFYRDAEKAVQHKHYSQLNTPIISRVLPSLRRLPVIDCSTCAELRGSALG